VHGTTQVALGESTAGPAGEQEVGQEVGSQQTPDAGKHASINPGDVLRGFKVERMIAAGGMAAIYKASQLSLNRPVALKILSTRYASNASFVQQFDSEMAALASLNHPNIVSIIDKGRVGDTYFFAMEYVEGTTLQELVRSGPIVPQLFVKIFCQCARALKYAHSRGIIHRDIKPSNIMVDAQSNAKVADFGLAGAVSRGPAGEVLEGPVMGTPGFMAPEQFKGMASTDGRSDIFSLGAVMYQTLTGALPAKPPVPAPSRLNPEADPRLDGIVLKCLKPNPEERFGSVDQLLEALESYRQELTRVAEVCPNCRSDNPVTAKMCLRCGADLSALFDLCPECHAENRRDLEVCLGCGTDLRYLRAQIAVLITRRRERARELAQAGRYVDAVRVLERISQVEGKRFEHARRQAADLIREYEARLGRQSLQEMEHGQALAAEGKLTEAVKVWKKIRADTPDDVDLAGMIREAEAKMAEARAGAKTVSALMAEHRCDEAASLLNTIAAAWPECPGLSEARDRLQKLQQTEQVIGYELKQVDRLLAAGDYDDAWKAMGFLRTSLPNHPLVKQKLHEVVLKKKQAYLTSLMGEAESLQEQGQYDQASRKWESAAALLGDSSPRKAEFLEKASAAHELSETGAEASGHRGKKALADAQAVQTGRIARRRGRKVWLIVLVAAAAAIAVGLGIAFWMGHIPNRNAAVPTGEPRSAEAPP
jgi:tetratricopeptide (TPR) repeat protein